MTQRDLNRAVARATGETVHEINRRDSSRLLLILRRTNVCSDPSRGRTSAASKQAPHLRQSAQV